MQYILNLLNIKREEAFSVFLLIFQSVFLGVFYGAFDIGASTLFLNHYNAEMLPKAFLISGMVGIVLTSLYSRFHSRISFNYLSIGNLLLITLLTMLMRFSFEIVPSDVIIFIVFIMMGPLNIVGLIGFWGTVTRMFSLRQGKRLFGLVDSGQVIGIIISSYAIPILLSFQFKTINTFLISSFSVFLALILQLIICLSYKPIFSARVVKVTVEEQEQKKKTLLFSDSYIILMVIFVALSMIAAFFVYNSFLAVTKIKYPEADDMARFLGFFTGTLMVFSLIIKSFVYSSLMKTYGLKASLILSPLVLLVLTLISSLIGSFGFELEEKTFLFFFLFIVLSRLFSVSLKQSIEGPSFKLLYQSLDKKVRYNIQAKIDGVVNEFSALFAGIILTGFGLLSWFKLIHFSYILVIILTFWLYVAYRLYMLYRRSLERSLEQSKHKINLNPYHDLDIKHYLSDILQENDLSKQAAVIETLAIIDPVGYDYVINQYLHKKPDLLLQLPTPHLKNIPFSENEFYLQLSNEATDKKRKEIIASQADETNRFREKFKSQTFNDYNFRSRDDKILAAKYIAAFPSVVYLKKLTDLLHDIDPQVKYHAIKAAAKIYNDEIIDMIVECITNPKLTAVCTSTLIEIGEPCLDQLEQMFYKSEISVLVQIQIIRIMGLTGGDKASHYLLNKLNYDNIEILIQTATSLRLCNYRADDHTIHRIILVIEKVLDQLAWIIAAQFSHSYSPISNTLEESLNEEITKYRSLLIQFLSIAYDPSSIEHVRENLEAETAEGTGFAIELLDLFVNEEIKSKLFLILEDTSGYDKIRQMESQFAVELLDNNRLITDLLNRDPGQTGRYTKICLLTELLKQTNLDIKNPVIAHLFNNDKQVRDSAALLLQKNNPELIKSSLKRTNQKNRIEIEQFLNRQQKSPFYIHHNKIVALKQNDLFKTLNYQSLTKLADYCEVKILRENEKLQLKNHFVFITEGTIGVGESLFTTHSYFGIDPDNNDEIIARTDCTLLTLEMKDLHYLIFHYQPIAICFIEILKTQPGFVFTFNT